MGSIERELAEWHRRLTSAKNARRTKHEESERVLASQRQHIEDERKLNKHMQRQLSIDVEATMSANQDSAQERKEKLQDLIETYSRKVEVESRQLESIQQELELTQAKAHELRRATGGHHAADAETKSAAKTIKLLENRLEQAEKRFGEAITHNNVLHREIDEHNKQRTTFEKVCSKLEQELATKQANLDLLNTSVHVAEEARAAAVRQLSTARTQEDKEAQAFELEMRELQACLGTDKQLLQAQTKRIEGVVEAAESSQHQSPQGKAPESIQSTEPEMDSDAVIAKLRQASGRGDLSKLVAYFCSLESLNFHLFDACNVANMRISGLKKELQDIKAETEHAESTGVMGRHKEITASTLAKRDQALKRAEAMHEKQVLLERRLALVRAGIGQALKTLGASLVQPSRPEDPECVYGALLRNLGTLEAKARAVLAVHSKIMDKNAQGGGEEHTTHEARPNSSASNASIGSRIMCAPPTTTAPKPSSASSGLRVACSAANEASSSDSDGSPAVPLSREQLQAQLHARM